MRQNINILTLPKRCFIIKSSVKKKKKNHSSAIHSCRFGIAIRKRNAHTRHKTYAGVFHIIIIIHPDHNLFGRDSNSANK